MRKLSQALHYRSCTRSWWPLRTIFSSEDSVSSMSKILMRVLEGFCEMVQAAARKRPECENLRRKAPYSEVSYLKSRLLGSSF